MKKLNIDQLKFKVVARLEKKKTMSRVGTWLWIDDVLPFVAMLTVTCLDMGVLTIVKAAMNDGMGSLAYVVYHNALGTLILLPFFIFHIIKKVDRPPLTLRILFRFFILGLIGLCLSEVLAYVGVNLSSPTMASAIFNLAPAVTFLIAVFFGMEKIEIRSSSSVAKLLGTMVALSGAMLFTFYQGPQIFHTTPSPDSPDQLLSLPQSNWILGGLIILVAGTLSCVWSVLQTATAREFPDQQTIVFFYCLFGTIQCMAISPFLEREQSAWALKPGTVITAVILGGVYSTVGHYSILTWCLEKKGPVFVSLFTPLSIVIAMIAGVTFLGDPVYLGSVIGAIIVVAGVYTVIWGQTKEKTNKLVVIDEDLVVSGSSVDQTAPLLSSRNESKC